MSPASLALPSTTAILAQLEWVNLVELHVNVSDIRAHLLNNTCYKLPTKLNALTLYLPELFETKSTEWSLVFQCTPLCWSQQILSDQWRCSIILRNGLKMTVEIYSLRSFFFILQTHSRTNGKSDGSCFLLLFQW